MIDLACGIIYPEYSSRNLESHVLTIRIQNPSSTDKHWNTVAGIRNPRLPKIPLHGVRLTKGWKIPSFFPSIYYKSSVDLVCYSP